MIFCGGERIDCKEDVAISRSVHPTTQDEITLWTGECARKGEIFLKCRQSGSSAVPTTSIPAMVARRHSTKALWVIMGLQGGWKNLAWEGADSNGPDNTLLLCSNSAFFLSRGETGLVL